MAPSPLPPVYVQIVVTVLNRSASNDNGCRVWMGATSGAGYGRLKLHKKLYSPHRVVLEAKLGRLLARDEDTRHRCDNPRCVNPDHLEPGSRRDNVMDAITRGRQRPPASPSDRKRCSTCARYLPANGRCQGTYACRREVEIAIGVLDAIQSPAAPARRGRA